MNRKIEIKKLKFVGKERFRLFTYILQETYIFSRFT